MGKLLTTKEFIEKARQVHGDKYDYSKVNYINSKTKVCIICPEHGEFWQTPNYHLRGFGCSKCKGFNRTTAEFIELARQVHGDKYDYSKIEYVSSTTKVCIICPEHGEFWQTPIMHLSGQNCPKCKGFNRTTAEFIELARQVHGDKYDYSKTEYRGSHKKIKIICPIHGEFEQIAKEHLKYGCKLCAKEKNINYFLNRKLTTEEFIERAKKIHGDKYDYSKVEYDGCEVPVCIICPIHGEFWSTPHTHLDNHICPFCASEQNVNENRLYELLCTYFPKNDIKRQKKFKWLSYKKKMSLDFYIEKYNVGIEYQGAQHFRGVKLFGGKKSFDRQIERDILKIKKCQENGIKLLHFTFNKNDILYFNKYDIITDIKVLINEIINEEK